MGSASCSPAAYFLLDGRYAWSCAWRVAGRCPRPLKTLQMPVRSAVAAKCVRKDDEGVDNGPHSGVGVTKVDDAAIPPKPVRSVFPMLVVCDWE